MAAESGGSLSPAPASDKAYARHLASPQVRRAVVSPELWRLTRAFASVPSGSLRPLPCRFRCSPQRLVLRPGEYSGSDRYDCVSNPDHADFSLAQYGLGSLLIGKALGRAIGDMLEHFPGPCHCWSAPFLPRRCWPCRIRWRSRVDWFGRRFLKPATSGTGNKSPPKTNAL